jgi:uncharacterized protein YndB with AHSA1/START domain
MNSSESPVGHPADREIISARLFAASREALFAAFADPERLAQWWGPKGFTCTIRKFDLRPGGKWDLVLHAPDGAHYHNEKDFIAVEKPARIVFRHVDPVHGFEMTMLFATENGQTRLTWRMLFDSAGECAKIRPIVVAANEQNFDRLTAHLARTA